MAGVAVVNALVASLCLFSGASAWPFGKRQTLSIEDIQKQALANAYKVLDGTISDGMTRSGCTKANVAVRKEYGDLTKDERTEYIRAVKCILQKPSKLPAGKYPGAKSRYDDFVVVHMNMTPSVHSTANFMHWHRYYIWAYETALRTECDYKGYQPYWNWGKYADLTTSPIFNGDEWSLGGNGKSVPHKGGFIGRQVPAGPGGGCVETGPFANLTIHLGPLSPTMDPALKIPSNPQRDGYGDNPRCLRRDVNNYFVGNSLKPANLASHITSNSAIGKFQDTLQNDTPQMSAIHSSGHFSIWGDPGGDVYVSPAEPGFWLHHGQLDRHWWMWANYLEKDLKTRASQYEGGTNWMNPNSAKGKPTDAQWLDVVAPTGKNGIASNQMFSTTAGPFCYVYE
ncbi:Di-copper centre-containing protein [Aaosphaeria arxii CBS 175.79]|uniref:Di-copper centre-containing protein n=1 Tax=Aaosphaeria arxii CBS 175.79 TaxID=1450172 RepID=A0A6A5XXR1_9PLEO|nr:Di-copper centre-containing protein [Aaosphaeria arxii CBS 175.79]KAF2017739.1 Di-copper centre-containing protein [Aaosphaeria arxii CBS 175.79]